MQALRFAFRQFAKSPGFTAIIVLTLALGLGTNTAIFSIINAAYLRALPYPEADRLVHLMETSPQWSDMSISYPNFQDWHERQDVFAALALYHTDGRKMRTTDGVEQVTRAHVSADFFRALGVSVAQGRDLAVDDDKPGAARVAWLTHETWQRWFAGEADLVGRSIVLDDEPVAVAGILPADFRFFRRADVFVPLAPHVEQMFMQQRENHNGTMGIGRLAAGVSLEQARTQITAIAQQLQLEHPRINTGIGAQVTSLRERLAGGARTKLYLLLGAVGMVLLIACVNVANMLLARSFARSREMAVRTALGATRGQLLRQLLVESLLLAMIGGAAGIALGIWGFDFTLRLVPGGVRNLVDAGSGLDLRVFLFVAGATLLTGVGFGLAPAWQLSHTNPNDALKNATRPVRTVFGRFHLRDMLVVVQVALALMLLVGAGLLIRSLQELTSISPGIRPERVLTLRVSPPPMDEYRRDPYGYVDFHQRILDAVGALPEVETAAFGSNLPFSGSNSSSVVFRTDRPPPEPGTFPAANWHVVSKDYFEAMGIPLLRGRMFDEHEPRPEMAAGGMIDIETIARLYRDTELACLVSQRMAEQIWPGEDPIGRQFQIGYPDMWLPKTRVIGVVGSTTQEGLARGPVPEYYVSLRQFPAPMYQHLVVRSRQEPAGILASVRSVVNSVVRDAPVFDVKLMSARITDSVSGRRFDMALFSFFAAMALLLSVVGIYGVLSFVVGQRTREVGVRMALGARRAHVLREILTRGMKLVALGTTLGVVGAWLVSRLLQTQLFGVTGNDVVTYLAGAVLLLLAAFLACLVPARRATKINPIQALRSE